MLTAGTALRAVLLRADGQTGVTAAAPLRAVGGPAGLSRGLALAALARGAALAGDADASARATGRLLVAQDTLPLQATSRTVLRRAARGGFGAIGTAGEREVISGFRYTESPPMMKNPTSYLPMYRHVPSVTAHPLLPEPSRSFRLHSNAFEMATKSSR